MSPPVLPALVPRVLFPAGNAKLGPAVASWSRPVGPTCPPTCPFLSGILPDGRQVPARERCYAGRIEARRPSVQTAWARAYAPGAGWVDAFVAQFTAFERRGYRAIRGHVGGDFCEPGGSLDRGYLATLLVALRRVRRAGATLPVWFYTHAWAELQPHRCYLERLGCIVFASVHGEHESRAALKLGYRLAVDAEAHKGEGLPARADRWGIPVLTCPEQRKGVPCGDCGYCFRDLPGRHVAFFRH